MTDKKYPFILILIAFFTHISWFNFNTILTYGDWSYWSHTSVLEAYYSWGTWISNAGFGSPNIQIPFYLFISLWSFFARLGLSYDQATKLTFFIPIAFLIFFSPYILIKKITGRNSIAFFSSLFYATTTYGISNQLPFQFVYALTPLLFYLFIIAFEKNNYKYWILFTLVFWVSICYEIRMTYIVGFILLIYFLFFYLKSLKKYFLKILFSLTILIMLNLFWFLPTIFGGLVAAISQVTGRGLFGENLLDLVHSITLFNWLWTGGRPDASFNQQPVIWFFWFLPLIAFLPFLFIKKFSFQERKFLVFFATISLLGIFLTKQSDFPFSGAYKLLYKYFPGFSLFRESSKFFLVSSFGYLGLIGLSLLALARNNKKKFYLIACLIVFAIFALNSKPLITGEISGLFVPRNKPMDYQILEKYVEKDKSFDRTLWLPTVSRWGVFDNLHPRINIMDMIGNSWKRYLTIDNNTSEGKVIVGLFRNYSTENLFAMSAIKYVVVPLEDKANDDYIFVYYSENRNYYINALDKISYLHKINIGMKDVVIYENENYKQHIYITDNQESANKNQEYKTVNFKFVSPTEYKVALKNISKSVYLNFSESYNSQWKLRVGQFNWLDVLIKKNYFISNKYHLQNDAGLNSYYINPTEVCKVQSCKVNKDGSYDMNMTLYFTPQSYMYLGLIISGGTLVLVLGYLGFVFGRYIYGKKR